jgi:magnesium transporter
MNGKSYLKILGLQQLFGSQRTKEILSVNPTVLPVREEAKEIRVFVYDYDTEEITQFESDKVQDCFDYKFSKKLSWINVDGLRKTDVEAVAQHFDIHPLLVEDILSINQRPKMDEVEGRMLCLLNMLYFNENKRMVETEQISIILGENFVISFQEDASRDVFNPLRLKLNMPKSQIRSRPADYLCYAMIDLIVDNYFIVMEKLGEQIESLEEELIRKSNNRSLIRINQLRKEHIVLKRNIGPVRDMVNSIIRSESDLLEDKTTKYFNDVYDHISQAFDLSENYRDVLMSMQDLYINNVNLRLNEVMKVMAIVTCLLAPATVIGGIFGMNFDIIPYAHHQWGFYFAVALMLVIPIWMLFIFRRRGWF